MYEVCMNSSLISMRRCDCTLFLLSRLLLGAEVTLVLQAHISRFYDDESKGGGTQ